MASRRSPGQPQSLELDVYTYEPYYLRIRAIQDGHCEMNIIERLFPPSSERFIVGSQDGDLYRRWEPSAFRSPYARRFEKIKSVAQLKSSLRSGQHSWPGQQFLYLVLTNREVLCFPCALGVFPRLVHALRTHSNKGWRVVGCKVNWDKPFLRCALCDKRMKALYVQCSEDERRER